jgi:seryl-tRNA synthetase
LQFKSLAEDKERKLSDLQEHVQKLEKESSGRQVLVETLQLQLKNSEAEIGNKSNRDEQEPVEEKVKTIMNKVYKEITKQFKPDESYTFHTIKTTVSVVIRVRRHCLAMQ